jgi:sensor histidine kinase YesM
MLFVQRLLDQSRLPLTVRQFWKYAFCYWSIFAVITLGQLCMLWILRQGAMMRMHEIFIWLLDGLFWWSVTPLVLYASLKIPIVFKNRQQSLLRAIFYHLLIVTFCNIFVNTFHYFITNPIMFMIIGKSIPVESYFYSFFVSYTASFGQYMLLVVGFNKVSYIYRYQILKQQHFEAELHNEQLRGQLANAQLQSLKMQLNPHFLFNTLHSVVSLMIKNDIRKATQMITTLSDLLRAVLVNQKSDFIPFHEELKLTQQYLAIQQIRFQDRLRVEYHIDPETEMTSVPQLILQPLVENSFTHGISELTTNALIRISGRIQGDFLQIDVFDNGIGVKQRKASAGTGLGLKNTLARLQQAYGENARLIFSHPAQGGTLVTLTFQCLPNPKIQIADEAFLPDHRR